ncbi:MAG: efflux RND transporter permease subunit [Synergistales bacterium]|nr:efflux RND transporter permease subunit [Synergistales bacterium]
MKLPEISVKRHVASLMVFLAIILVGSISLLGLKLDMLPDIEPPIINLITPWPGASASDVEQRVTKILEDYVSLIEGVDDIYSKSLDNISVVTIKFKWGTDLDVKAGDVRDIIPMAKSEMPDDIDEPVLLQITSGAIPVIGMSLTTSKAFQGLYHFADNIVIEELSRIPGVGKVMVYGGVTREIRINLDIELLEAHHIPPQYVIEALEKANVNIPAGSMEQGKTEYYVRVPGRFVSVDEINDLVIGINEGRPVYLSQVAEVIDGYKEQKLNSWHYDQPSIFMAVLKNSDANTIEVSRMIHEKLSELKATSFPEGVEYHIALDTADFIMMALKNLTTSLLAGIVLVFVVTWAFLKRLPASLVVCSAIPFSLIITFIAMGRLDYTINIFTLSALAVASGMVVDNSIVATDQIIHHIEQGERGHVAAVLGASEVGSALVASTLTTAVVLLPLAFISGLVGVFFSSLTVVMVLAVVASLFVSLSFIPTMASRFFHREVSSAPIHRVTERFLARMEKGYGAMVSWSLNNRKKVILFSLLLLAMTFIGFRFIGTELAPNPDTGDVEISFTLPEGTRINVTDALVREVIAYCDENIPEALTIYGYDGMEEEGFSIAAGQEAGTNIGTVGMKLVEKQQRERSAFEIAQTVRNWLREKPGIEKMTVQVTSPIKSLFMGSKPLNIEVYGDDLEEVIKVAGRIRDIISEIPGAVDLSLSQKQNRPEKWTSIDKQKAALLGVNTATIANTLRTYLYGFETSENFWEGEDDYPIMVRLKEEQRNDLEIFNRIKIPSSKGQFISLSTFAQVKDALGPPEIERKNKQRYVTVEGNIHGSSLGQVTQEAKRLVDAMEIPSGIRIAFGGEIKEQADAFRQMGYLVLLGILLVYMVMAGQYEAYLDPFVIMFSIPFALTGVVLAYLITGIYLSLQGILGVIMLIGIVVNNAIVLVDYINLLRARGEKMREALISAGERRLRPILMTTLTTFFGMLPMAVSQGQGSEMWRPLAVSVMGGLVVSMGVTLLLIPVVYSIVEERVRKIPRFAEAMEVSDK